MAILAPEMTYTPFIFGVGGCVCVEVDDRARRDVDPAVELIAYENGHMEVHRVEV